MPYLRHRGIREDDSAYRFLHGGDALHQDPVKEGHQTLQTAGHVSPSLSLALSRSVSLLLAFAARLFAGDFLLEPRAKRLFLKARECVCVCYEESRDDVVVGGFP